MRWLATNFGRDSAGEAWGLGNGSLPFRDRGFVLSVDHSLLERRAAQVDASEVAAPAACIGNPDLDEDMQLVFDVARRDPCLQRSNHEGVRAMTARTATRHRQLEV